ncbi:kinase-like domain-containing protein [Tirmania nivea]|nr:kinase-like domain-containing protein [Tirmania nivea]
MERSWSVDRALSLFHPQQQHPAERSNDQLERFITSKTSRYKTDFTELAFLGKGGFASVFKVRNILDGREYAIKKVPIRTKHLNDKGDKLDVIFKEIKTLAKLEHGNIVRYYSAWVESATGLWERPGKNTWSAAPEARGKAASPKIVAQVITGNMNLEQGTTPDKAKTKSGSVITEIPSGNTTSVSIRNSSKKPYGIGKENLDSKQLAVLQAARIAKREADRKEILTLMIMMSVHPLTLKEFLQYEGSESTKHSAQYCWHLKCALKLFRGVLDGVEYLHNKGIVHRDFKPGNIFLNIEVHDQYVNGAKDRCLDCRYCEKRCELIPRIGDFGLVAELVDGVRKRDRGGEGEAGDGDILRGNVVGTALYRPPPSTDEDEEDVVSSSDDRRRKNIICEKTDIYALGIIFFELLYRCDTGSERVKCIMDVREGRKLPGDWQERVCKEGRANGMEAETLGRCVMGMTEKRRAHRWDLGRIKVELRVLEGWE